MFPNKTCGKDHQMVSESLFENNERKQEQNDPGFGPTCPVFSRFQAAAGQVFCGCTFQVSKDRQLRPGKYMFSNQIFG
jgi:hypothetical protein